MIRFFLFGILFALCVGCSQKPSTVKGSLVQNGKPYTLPKNAGEVYVVLHGIGADGKVDAFKMYAGKVNSDGTFEVVSSMGELPPGTYQWSIDSTASGVKEFEPFQLKKTKTRIELVPGPNQIVLDLSAK